MPETNGGVEKTSRRKEQVLWNERFTATSNSALRVRAFAGTTSASGDERHAYPPPLEAPSLIPRVAMPTALV